MINRRELIRQILKFPNESYKKLIISKNMSIYYKHNYVTPTYINHISNISGNIFGFSISGHKYINETYFNSSRSNTIWDSSEPRNVTFKEIYERKSIHSLENVKEKMYYLDSDTYFPIKNIKHVNMQLTTSSLYICNNLLCFDPSMQLLDLISLYIQKKVWRDKDKIMRSIVKDDPIPYTKDDNERFKEKLINIFYNPIPTDGMPLIVKDIQELEESDYK